MFAAVAVLLFVLAAIFEFTKFHAISALGLAFVGLACVAVHLYLTSGPYRYPWVRGQ